MRKPIMANISFDNLHPGGHRPANSLFRYGYIIGDPGTGRVFGYYISRKIGDHHVGQPFKELEPVQPEELPETAGADTIEWFREALRHRYPNCRVRLIGQNKPHRELPRALILLTIGALCAVNASTP